MQDLQQTTSAVLVPVGVPCVQCGYELGGISLASVCPECGTSASSSYQPGALIDRPSAYLDRLVRALRFTMGSIIVMVLVSIGVAVIGAAMVANGGAVVTLPLYVSVPSMLLSLLTNLLVAWGAWRVLVPSPRDGFAPIEAGSFKVARIALIATVLMTTVQSVAGMGIEVVFALHGDADLYAVLSLALTAFGLLGYAAMLTHGSAMMLHLRRIGMWGPDRKLVKMGMSRAISIPIYATVGVLLIGLGPLIALILYYNTMLLAKKRLKAIRDAQTVPIDEPPVSFELVAS